MANELLEAGANPSSVEVNHNANTLSYDDQVQSHRDDQRNK